MRQLKTLCISLFSKWEGCRCRLQLPCRLLAGGLCKSPPNGASQPHTFGSLSFSLSEIKIKQIPDGAPYRTGRGDTLLRFLQGKPSSKLFLAPPLMASTNRHPALHLGTHIHPQIRTKAYPYRWDFSKLQHASQQYPVWYPQGRAGLSLCTGLLVWGEHLLGPAWRRTSTHLPFPAQFKASLRHLQAPQMSPVQERRQRQPNLWRWAKANKLLRVEKRARRMRFPRKHGQQAKGSSSLRPAWPSPGIATNTAAPTPAPFHNSGQQPQKSSKQVTGKTQTPQARNSAARSHQAHKQGERRGKALASNSLQLRLGGFTPLLQNLRSAFA